MQFDVGAGGFFGIRRLHQEYFIILRGMTAKLKIGQILGAINRILTRINLTLAIFVFSAGLPKNRENMTIPPAVNIILLVILVAFLFMYITGYSNAGPQPSNIV